MRKTMILVGLLMTQILWAGNLSMTVVPPSIDSEGETIFAVAVSNNNADSAIVFVKLLVSDFFATPVVVDSMTINLSGLATQAVDLQWNSKIGRHRYIVQVDSFKTIGDFYLFGPRHPVDIVISESVKKQFHGETMKKAILYVDSTLNVDIYWSTDVIGAMKYADWNGAVAIVQGWTSSMNWESYFKNSQLLYFAPLGQDVANKLYEYWPYRVWDNVIISSACDSLGKRIYGWGPNLEFVEYFPLETVSSYTECVIAGKFVVLKHKLENYYGRIFSKEEVRQVARLSTGKMRCDSVGYGIINVNFPFWNYLGLRNMQTGVADLKSMPMEFSLKQNYPNPFNSSTAIIFNLQNGGNVRLMIFNIRGEHVAELVNGWQFAGGHSVNWDASELASGKYILVMQTERGMQTKNMTLLK